MQINPWTPTNFAMSDASYDGDIPDGVDAVMHISLYQGYFHACGPGYVLLKHTRGLCNTSL